jgi:hypothetical protein
MGREVYCNMELEVRWKWRTEMEMRREIWDGVKIRDARDK